MIITLNRDEILSAVVQNMGSLVGDLQDAQVGFINGDLAVVISVNEEIPDGMFDGEELYDASSNDANDTEETQGESSEDQGTDKPAKQVKRRKRRTRAEIEADEAAAKQAAEAEQSQQATGEAEGESQDAQQSETETQEETPVLESKPEAGSDNASPFEAETDPTNGPAGEDDGNIFDPKPVVDESAHVESSADDEELFSNTEPDPQVGANPFPSDNDGESLFDEPAADVKPVTETEDGFAKPREDDDALALFQ